MKSRLLIPLIVASALCATESRGADWPQYNGPEFDRKNGESFTPGNWKSGGPEELWKIDCSDGFSSFVTGDGKAFTLVKSGDRERLIAVDEQTGGEAWHLDLGPAKYHGGGNSGARDNKGGDGPRSTPVFNGGGVFVYDAKMNLYAVAAATGKLVWKQSIGEDFGGKEIQWQNAASPIVLGGKVIVPGGGAGQAFLAFDRKTGKVAWKSGQGTMTHATPSVATIQDKEQVLFFMRRGVVAVDPENGDELWEYEFDFRTASAITPVVHDDIVSVAAGYGVGGGACKVSKSGTRWKAKEIWRKKDSAVGNIWSTPVCVDGYMYGMFSAKKYGDGPLKCIDIRDGEVKWEERGFGQGHVSMAGDKLLALSDAGDLVVIDPSPRTYDEVTRAKVIDGKCWSTPVYANGHIFVRSTTSGVCLVP